MLTKKQMLIALMLGASAMGASYAIEVDFDKVADNSDIRKFKGVTDELATFAIAFKKQALKGENGDFTEIRKDLAKVNLTPGIQFLIDNIDNFRDKLEGFVKILQNQMHEDHSDHATAEGVVLKVQEKLESLDSLKGYLEIVLPYGDFAKHQDVIAKAIKAANSDPKFREQLQTDIEEIAKKVNRFSDQIQAIGIEKIQNALKSAVNLFVAVDVGDLELQEVQKVIAPGIKELRMNLLPIAPAIATELTATVLKIYNTLMDKGEEAKNLYRLDQRVINALEEINKIGKQVKTDLDGLNKQITSLAEQVFAN